MKEKKKKPRLKFNPGLGANRPSNNWGQKVIVLPPFGSTGIFSSQPPVSLTQKHLPHFSWSFQNSYEKLTNYI